MEGNSVVDRTLYVDPVSENSIRFLKRMVLLSSLIILNHFYAVDLSESHLFGIKFEGTAPALNGLFGIVLIYFALSFFVYVYKDISSWVAQDAIYRLDKICIPLSEVDRKLDQIVGLLESQRTYNSLLSDEIDSLREVQEPDKFPDRITYENYVDGILNTINRAKANIEANSYPLSENVAELKQTQSALEEELSKVSRDYRKMYLLQFIKIGILETFLPSYLAIQALYFSHTEIAQILATVFL